MLRRKDRVGEADDSTDGIDPLLLELRDELARVLYERNHLCLELGNLGSIGHPAGFVLDVDDHRVGVRSLETLHDRSRSEVAQVRAAQVEPSSLLSCEGHRIVKARPFGCFSFADGASGTLSLGPRWRRRMATARGRLTDRLLVAVLNVWIVQGCRRTHRGGDRKLFCAGIR